MSLADALRVIQAGDELVDLKFALALLGFRLRPALPEAEAEAESGETELDDAGEDEEDEGYAFEWSQDDLDDLPDEDWPDAQAGIWHLDQDTGWQHPTGGPSNGQDDQSPRPIPFVLDSEDILKAKTEFAPLAAIERPRSEREQEQLERDRITQYTAEWPAGRIRRFLQRSVPGKLVDVDEVVLLLAKAEPLKQIPTLPRSKVSASIQVVYDVGLFVGPYGFDLHALIEVIRLAGVTDMERIAFRHRIANGCGSGPSWKWQQYQAPAGETAVVLVSGGYGDDVYSRVGEFQQLMASLDRRGHPVHAVWFGDIPKAFQLTPRRWIIRS